MFLLMIEVGSRIGGAGGRFCPAQTPTVVLLHSGCGFKRCRRHSCGNLCPPPH